MPDKVKVTNRRVTTFFQVEDTSLNGHHDMKWQEGRLQGDEFLSNKREKPKLSKCARKRFTDRYALWRSSVEAHRVLVALKTGKRPLLANFMTFCTLTLPSEQTHEDGCLKLVLAHFIAYVQYKRNLLHTYIWFAERQKNGNLHFHVICDGFYDHKQLRTDWNRFMAKHGYIAAFRAKFGHENAPSTEISNLQKGVEDYLVKDALKKEQKENISGALWKGSCNLSKRKAYIVDAYKERDFLDAILCDPLLKSYPKEKEREPLENPDYFKIYYGKGVGFLSIKYPNFKPKLDYYEECYRWLYHKKIANGFTG